MNDSLIINNQGKLIKNNSYGITNGMACATGATVSVMVSIPAVSNSHYVWNGTCISTNTSNASALTINKVNKIGEPKWIATIGGTFYKVQNDQQTKYNQIIMGKFSNK